MSRKKKLNPTRRQKWAKNPALYFSNGAPTIEFVEPDVDPEDNPQNVTVADDGSLRSIVIRRCRHTGRLYYGSLVDETIESLHKSYQWHEPYLKAGVSGYGPYHSNDPVVGFAKVRMRLEVVDYEHVSYREFVPDFYNHQAPDYDAEAHRRQGPPPVHERYCNE